MDDLLAAEVQRDDGVTKNTRDKETRVWKRWVEYTKLIEFDHDIWLESLLPENRAKLRIAFAAALRRRQFSRLDEKNLAAGTVQEAVAKLQTWGTTPPQPFATIQGNEEQRSRRGSTKNALPVCVYRELHRVANYTPQRNIIWI